jgi:SET domain-containing protein
MVAAGQMGEAAARHRRLVAMLPNAVEKPAMYDRLVANRQLPNIARRRSAVHGDGVFAVETIPKNRRIIDYAGELIRNDARCEAREEAYLKEGCIWVFRVNRAWSRDANVGGNLARFINHSCTPNCWFEVVDRTIWIRAARTIRRGEELTYDYSIIGTRTIPCHCRPGCPNFI